ncbi:WxL domain-containing protein [Enterococcus sp. AZ196]|uniref:WxL domain-containing protein n=1 Tax=Enterococcus sp. AZ196 TaxID=2774659 RepID=UPI003D2D8687
MKKKQRIISVMLGILVISLSLLLTPKVFAARTGYFPAMEGNIRFLDRDGTDFSKTLNLQGVIQRGEMGYGGTPILTQMPLSISKDPGKNEFTLHFPEFNETTQPWTVEYSISRRAQDLVIPTVSSARYVKHFILNKGNPVSYVKHNTWHANTGGFGESLIYFVRQSDGSFKGVVNLNPNPNTHLSLGLAAVREDFLYPNTSEAYIIGDTGLVIDYYAVYQQFKEVFEDESGASITPPTGYTQNKLTDITSDPYTYTMNKGSSLPKVYVVGTDAYTYKGWYKGKGNKASINDTYPPSITSQAEFDDSKDEIHIVYEKRTARTVKELYVSTTWTNIHAPSNTTQTVGDGNTFEGNPPASKTDAGNSEWEYNGWKLSTESSGALRPKTTPVSLTINADTNIQYQYTRKKRTTTERYLKNSDSTPISVHSSLGISNPRIATIDDNGTFYYGRPTLIDTSLGVWDMVGWENVTDDPGVINSTNGGTLRNVKEDKEFNYYYSPRKSAATIDLTPNPKIINSGGSVSWTSRVTNTSTTVLKDLVLKKTANWSSGLAAPTQVTVTPATGAAQTFPVTASDWTSGVTLTGVSIPVTTNNYADITFSTTSTGAVNQVLPAEIELNGNISTPIEADNFIRIDDPDEPNLEPGNAGLINIPSFKFGQVEVKTSAQTKKLDAASYQSGYNPYIRLIDKESMGGWALTAKLGQFTSGTKTLPTTTSINLKNGDLKEVNDYDKHNESMTSIGGVGNKVITSDGATVSLTNGGSQGVYQLDYAISDVELNLLGNTGIAGNTYTANMDWILTTAP